MKVGHVRSGRLGSRATATLLAVLLATTTLVTATERGAHAAPADLAAACPDPIPQMRFEDVSLGDAHGRAIACLVAWGITEGVSATRYAPEPAVRREQMATFLVRLIGASGAPLTAPDSSSFSDVGGVHADSVESLAAVGIAQGTSSTTFSPSRAVNRGQMATFLVRTLDHLGVDLPEGQPTFDDVRDGVHAPAIDALARAGIVQGQTPTTYAPERDVTRAQMASFLMRTTDVLVTRGITAPPYGDTTPPGPAPGGDGVRLSSSFARSGDVIRVTSEGHRSGQRLRIEFHSTPIVLTSDTADDEGTLETEVTVPDDANDGDHSIVVVPEDDTDERARTAPLRIDNVPPTVESVEASPGEASPGDPVQIDWHLTDASGVVETQYRFVHAATGTRMRYSETCDNAPDDGTGGQGPHTGDATDGHYRATCVIPDGTNDGDYHLDLYALDEAGNILDHTTAPLLTVTGGGSDFDPPEVQSVTVTPSDASPGDPVQIDWHLTDASGVVETQYRFVHAATGTPLRYTEQCSNQPDDGTGGRGPHTGDATDGHYRTTCVIPDGINDGDYHLDLYALDRAGNVLSHTTDPLLTVTSNH